LRRGRVVSSVELRRPDGLVNMRVKGIAYNN
jgi:hypothetical protein